jgi:hypothetical protein
MLFIQRVLRMLFGICINVRVGEEICRGGETYLDDFKVSNSFEAGVEERYLLDFETIDPVGSVDIYAVANVVWVLDKKEDARGEKFLCSYREDEGEGEKGCRSC